MTVGDKVVKDVKSKIEGNQQRLEMCVKYLKRTLVPSLELREHCLNLFAKTHPENMFEDGIFNKKDYSSVIEKAKSFAPLAIKTLEINPDFYFEP